MRFKTFLKEEEIDSIDDITKRISNDCQQFLKESRLQPLYRGFGNKKKLGPNGGYFLSHPEDRKPLDSDDGFNFMFNAGCDAAFGIREIRKKSLFCTGDSKLAQNYGALNFVFPTGDIDYIWALKIKDSFESRNRLIDDILLNLNKAFTDKEFNDVMSFLSEHIDVHNFADNADATDVKFFMRHIVNDREIPEQEEIVDAMSRTFNEFYTNNDSLDMGIKKGVEILIYKSDGYYIIPVSSARQMLINDGIMTQLGAEAAEMQLIYKKLINKIQAR